MEPRLSRSRACTCSPCHSFRARQPESARHRVRALYGSLALPVSKRTAACRAGSHASVNHFRTVALFVCQQFGAQLPWMGARAQGSPGEGVALIRQGLSDMLALGSRAGVSEFLSVLAEA